MRKILMMMAALLPLVATAQKSTATLTFSGLDEGTRVVVGELMGGRMVPKDTVALDSKGRMKVESRTSAPAFFLLSLEGTRDVMLHCLLLPREKVTMTVDYDKLHRFLLLTSTKGSENMEAYRKYNNAFHESITDEQLRASMPATMEQLVGDNSHLLMSAFLVTFFEQSFDQYALLYKKVYEGLKGRYASNDFVRHIEERLRTAVVVGMEAPDIVLPDTSGVHQLRLSDLRGKVVLIDFWASWCGPCRKENPNVVRTYKKYHDLGFEVFSVSLDDDRDRWLQAIQKDGLVWPYHVSDLMGWKSAGGKLYGISSIPATVLVDRDGTVLARNLRGTQLENKLKEVFGQ